MYISLWLIRDKAVASQQKLIQRTANGSETATRAVYFCVFFAYTGNSHKIDSIVYSKWWKRTRINNKRWWRSHRQSWTTSVYCAWICMSKALKLFYVRIFRPDAFLCWISFIYLCIYRLLMLTQLPIKFEMIGLSRCVNTPIFHTSAIWCEIFVRICLYI